MIEPDYDNLKETSDINDFKLDQMGFALAKWKFPEGTRFPCLFVKDTNGHGLIYVQEGKGFITSPEIDLARRMGAEIEISSGVVVPAKPNGVRPFLQLAKWVNDQRRMFNKKEHPFKNAFYKLIGNNIYGKVAQGLNDKSGTFDRGQQRIGRSPISDAYVAAYVTGLVRATTSEILSLLPADVLVGNTITDGICTTATKQQMELATKGPQCQFFADLRESMTGSRNILEVKGRSEGMVFMRTRMHGSQHPTDDSKPILAKVNMPMDHIKTAEGEDLSYTEKNQILIKTFLDREWDKKWKSRSPTTANKLWITDGDLRDEEKVQYLGMDYDFKRRPVEPTESPVHGYTNSSHVSFKTTPWRTYEEYATARKVFDRFKEPLKLVGDVDAILQEIDTYGNKKQRPRANSRLKLFVEDFTKRAAVGANGITNPDGSKLKPNQINAIANKLSNGEVEIKGDKIRQLRTRITSGKTMLQEGYLVVTTSVSAADVTIKKQFPKYDSPALKSKIRLVGEGDGGGRTRSGVNTTGDTNEEA